MILLALYILIICTTTTIKINKTKNPKTYCALILCQIGRLLGHSDKGQGPPQSITNSP